MTVSTKIASRACGAPLAKNPPLRSGFSGLLGFIPQSPNTQNSSAATPRSGADFEKTSQQGTVAMMVKNGNEDQNYFQKKQAEL